MSSNLRFAYMALVLAILALLLELFVAALRIGLVPDCLFAGIRAMLKQ